MPKQAHHNPQVKLLKVSIDDVKGFSYKVKNGKGYIADKKYFRPNRCKGLVTEAEKEKETKFEFDDGVYGNFLRDVELIKSNQQVSSLAKNPSTSLTITLLNDSVTLHDTIKNTKKAAGANNSSNGNYLSDTLSYLFGEGDSKLKAKKIIESLKKQKKLNGVGSNMNLSNNMYGDLVKNVPKKRGRPPKIPSEAKVSKEEKVPKKRGRPPLKHKGLFNVYDPAHERTLMNAGDLSPNSTNIDSSDVSGLLSTSNELKADGQKKFNVGKKKVKKSKPFSAFAESYKPLNGYLTDDTVAHSSSLSGSLPYFSILEPKINSGKGASTSSKEEIVVSSLKEQLQAAILIILRYQSSDNKLESSFKNDIANLQNSMLIGLINESHIQGLTPSLNSDFFLNKDDLQGSGKIQFGDIETIQTFPKNAVKIKKEVDSSIFEPAKALETPEVVISRLFSDYMDEKPDSLAISDQLRALCSENNDTDFNIRSHSDYIIASALNDIAASVISKKGPYVKYKHLLEFVAITLNEDKSNSLEVLENLSSEIVPVEFANMSKKQKQKFLFGIKHLSISLMKYKGNGNGVFKQQIITADDHTTPFSNLYDSSIESVKDAVNAANVSYSESVFSKEESQKPSAASLRNILSEKTLSSPNESADVLKKLALKDFNAKTSEELRMEARLEQLKEEAANLGVELTQEKIAMLIQQVAEEQATQSQVDNDDSKLKKGRKIRKNYVLPPEPHKKSLYYEQEHKKYLAAKEYLLNPGKTSLREVCQKHKISVPTLITYMDAGRVARMLVTGKYSGSTVIRDSSFNNRGTSSFPEQIKSLYLQKTYEKILEAKKKTMETNGSGDDNLVTKLAIAKQQMAKQQYLMANAASSQSLEFAAYSQSIGFSANPNNKAASVSLSNNSSEGAVDANSDQKMDVLTAKIPSFLKQSQEALAEKLLKAKTPAEVASILLELMSNIVTNGEEARKELIEKIKIDQISKECVETMRNSIEGIVDSNFDFDSFMEGVFKKRRGRGAVKKANSKQSSLGPQSELETVSRDVSVSGALDVAENNLNNGS